MDSGAVHWLRYMEQSCHRIINCSAGMDQDTFVMARDLYESSMWNLVLVGEAASNVPSAFKANHPQIPWRLITGARNVFVHQFWRIDNDIVWDIVKTHVPKLLTNLGELIDRLGEKEEA